MKPQFTPEQETFIKVASKPEGEPFEWGVNWPSLQKMLPEKAARTLDFGCSGGYLLPYLPGEVKEGCDSDDAALAIAATLNPGYRYFKWDGENPCSNGPYDFIFAKMTLHLLPHYEKAVKNFRDVLLPGGTVVVSYPHPFRTIQYGFGNYDVAHTYKVRLSYVDLEVTSVHRSVAHLIKPFLDVGMVMTCFDEVYRPPALILKQEDSLFPNRINLAFRLDN